MKKIIVSIIVIGLLMTTSIASVNAFNIEEETMELEMSGSYFHAIPFANIYVDNNNTDGPWDGSYEHPYQYIQDGIDNADSGDIIYVFSGTYYENVELDKPITLRGQNKDETIIDGDGGYDNTLFVSADSVYIRGFTILKSSYWESRGIYVSSNYNTIIGNKIIGHRFGIYLSSSSNNSIIGNIIKDNDYHSILLEYSSDNVISENTIENNDFDGIRIGHGVSNNNNISGNTIKSNGQYGINLCNNQYVTSYVIMGNSITNNGKAGIGLSRIKNSIITGNNIAYNWWCGIGLFGSGNYGCNNNSIFMNNISHNYEDGIIISWGSSNNNISKNNIADNHGNGIEIYQADNNIVFRNDIINNDYGIFLNAACNNVLKINNITENRIGINITYDKETVPPGVTLYYPSTDNVIEGNNITDNGEYGVIVKDHDKLRYRCKNNHFYYNNFVNNAKNAYDEGMVNLWYKPKGLLRGVGNYWDDYTGEDNNGDGIGDELYIIPPYNLINNDRFPLMNPFTGSQCIPQSSLQSNPSSPSK